MGGAWSWAAGCLLLLLALNGKQKMAREKFGKEGNFSVSSSLEKSILSHPCLTAEGGGFPNTAQEGLLGGGQRRQKVPSGFTRMEQPWATSFVLGVEPNLAPIGGQDPSHSFPKGLGCPRCSQLKKGWGVLGSGVMSPCRWRCSGGSVLGTGPVGVHMDSVPGWDMNP